MSAQNASDTRTRRQWLPLFASTLLAPSLLAQCSVRNPRSTEDKSFKKRYKGFRYCSVEAVKQTSQKSCGAAALTAVLNYWTERYPPYEEKAFLEKNPPRSEEGYPLIQLREMALAEGLAAFAVSLDDDPWKQLVEHVDAGRPVITAIECPRGRYYGKPVPLVGTLDRRTVLTTGNEWKSHYVVVMGRNYQEVLVMDPKYGIVRVNRDDFVYFWKREAYAALICSSL